ITRPCSNSNDLLRSLGRPGYRTRASRRIHGGPLSALRIFPAVLDHTLKNLAKSQSLKAPARPAPDLRPRPNTLNLLRPHPRSTGKEAPPNARKAPLPLERNPCFPPGVFGFAPIPSSRKVYPTHPRLMRNEQKPHSRVPWSSGSFNLQLCTSFKIQQHIHGLFLGV